MTPEPTIQSAPFVPPTTAPQSVLLDTVLNALPTSCSKQLTRLLTNWKDHFTSDELVDKSGAGKCIRLRGLQRCANMCGLVESYPELNYIERGGKAGIIQCIYHVKFNDGTHFAGAADVNQENIDDKFSKYPTAVAESRAEARALRKALGITDMMSAEEVDMPEGGTTGQKDIAPTEKAEKQQVTAIQVLLQQLNIDTLSILNEVLGTERTKQISSIDEITVAEAIQIIRVLNEKRSNMPTTPSMATGKKLDISKKKES
jgi:hypothetical protein